jgi:hydroxypyruvate isomerase
MSSKYEATESGPLFQNRRQMMKSVAGAAALTLAGPLLSQAWAVERKGRIRHSVCLWCYDAFMKREKMSLDAFAEACVKLGLKSIELVTPDKWPILKKHGLICAMTKSHPIPKGFNRVANHAQCGEIVRKGIDASAEAGYPNVICFSGNRAGMDDKEGLANCIAGLKGLAGYAEKKKVTICLEFLNSHNHKDYMADSTKWCVDFVHGVGSPRVKVLYDIYHAGMMKENIIADIKEHHDCWGHYHTGGVPGRHEIDETQTLDYAKIFKTIAATGFQGYAAQEFSPKREDALKSLDQAIGICDA